MGELRSLNEFIQYDRELLLGIRKVSGNSSDHDAEYYIEKYGAAMLSGVRDLRSIKLAHAVAGSLDQAYQNKYGFPPADIMNYDTECRLHWLCSGLTARHLAGESTDGCCEHLAIDLGAMYQGFTEFFNLRHDGDSGLSTQSYQENIRFATDMQWLLGMFPYASGTMQISMVESLEQLPGTMFVEEALYAIANKNVQPSVPFVPTIHTLDKINTQMKETVSDPLVYDGLEQKLLQSYQFGFGCTHRMLGVFTKKDLRIDRNMQALTTVQAAPNRLNTLDMWRLPGIGLAVDCMFNACMHIPPDLLKYSDLSRELAHRGSWDAMNIRWEMQSSEMEKLYSRAWERYEPFQSKP